MGHEASIFLDGICCSSLAKNKSRESKCSFGFYGPSGETRLHLRQMAPIEERLGRALAGNARPHCIEFFESLARFKNKREANASLLFLVRVARLELAASCSQITGGTFF